MSKRAKRGKAETFALPMAARVAIGAIAVATLGLRLAVSPGKRATGTEAVPAGGPGIVNSGLRGASGSCFHSGSSSDSGPAGRTTESRC